MKKIYLLAVMALCAIAFSSCVEDELYPYASISTVTNTVAYSAADQVTVEAAVSALVDVESVTLSYSTGGSYTQVPMSKSGNVYVGTIPAYEKDTEVSYYVTVVTASGAETTSATNKYVVGQVPVDYTGLRLNELNGNSKFIELYNAGDHDIYLGGIKMHKDSNFDTETWTGPEVNLKKGEYMVLYSEDLALDIDASLVFHSGLSAKKSVRITILKPNGETIDDFNLNNDAGTKYAGSFGRNADGNWYHQTTPTPGAVNIDGEEALTMK